MTVRVIEVAQRVLADNDAVAESNRRRFHEAGVFVVNLIASPGAGKTSLIIKTMEALADRARVGVIEGDVAGSLDAEKVLGAGAQDAVQINTEGGCHLEAAMVRRALDDLALDEIDLLFIENVGNLICPTHWDLGQDLKVCLASVAEGDDKPVKYPEIFATSDVVVLNKIDLAEHVDFKRERFYEPLRPLNPRAPVFELSCRSGEGVLHWAHWLLGRR